MHFSPLGTKLYFHGNSLRKNAVVLTPNMAALSRGCKPRILATIVKHFDWAGYSQQRRRTYFNTVSEDNKNNSFRPTNG